MNERDDALRRAQKAIDDLASATWDFPHETERELAAELNHAHELLTDAGIPRVDPHDETPNGLAVRVGLLIDESNSVHAELDGLLKNLTP